MINNYKLAIITPDSIVYKGDIYGMDNHERVMRKYGIEEYGDNSIFGLFGDDFSFNLVEYYLASYQNILFYNLSGGDDDNKFGIFYVLNNIDENQLKLVQGFLDNLEGFTVELDSFVKIDDELVMKDPFEESYDDGFVEIRQFFNDITIKNNLSSKKK